MGNVGCVSCEVTEKLQVVVVVAVLFAILTCLVYCLPPARLTGVPSVGKTCCCRCCCRTVVRTWYLASPVQAGEGYIMTLGSIAQISIPPLYCQTMRLYLISTLMVNFMKMTMCISGFSSCMYIVLSMPLRVRITPLSPSLHYITLCSCSCCVLIIFNLHTGTL